MSDDDALLADLARMWARLDPPPPGLVEDVLLRLAPELDDDVELLALLEPALLGAVRGAAAETLRFTLGDVEVLLRLDERIDGRRRVDGWLAPSTSGRALLRTASTVLEAEVEPTGRFEFSAVAAGTATLELRLDPDARRLRTPPFPL